MFVRLRPIAAVGVVLTVGVATALVLGDFTSAKLTTTKDKSVRSDRGVAKRKLARPPEPQPKRSAAKLKLAHPTAPEPQPSKAKRKLVRLAVPTAKRSKIERPPAVPRKAGSPGTDTVSPFDIIQIDPKGVSVFAGLAKPNQRVTVLADGVAIGMATTDADGNWVLVTEQIALDPQAKFTVKSGAVAAKEPVKVRVAEVRKSVAKRPATVKDVTARMIKDLERALATARRSKRQRAALAPAPRLIQKPASRPIQKPAPLRIQTPATKTPILTKQVAVTRDVSVPRGPVSRPIPVPIQFVYRTSTFTQDGEKAAHLLLEYLKVGNFREIALTGHADERGSHSLNRELSQNRLGTVRDYLRAGGFTGDVILKPLGETKPFEGIDRSKFSRAELYQLDRRVELHLIR